MAASHGRHRWHDLTNLNRVIGLLPVSQFCHMSALSLSKTLRMRPPPSDKTIDTEDFQMNIATAIIALILTLACIVAANALMRLFDVKDATPEQSQAEAEKLLAQFTPQARMLRRVRAGPPSNAALADFARLSSLSAPRPRIPSA